MGRQGRLPLAIADSVAAVKITVTSGSGGAHLRNGTSPYIIGQLLDVVVGKGQSVMEHARALVRESGGVPETALRPSNSSSYNFAQGMALAQAERMAPRAMASGS